jgi:predicted alpha/beta-fold hydrolase
MEGTYSAAVAGSHRIRNMAITAAEVTSLKNKNRAKPRAVNPRVIYDPVDKGGHVGFYYNT